MPQSTHNRLAELHTIAEHTHAAAAHEQPDHLTSHELTKEAEEHNRNTHERYEELAAKIAKGNKA